MNQKTYIEDYRFRSSFNPKEPSPRNPINKDMHDQAYNQGWNDCMTYLKAVGKI